MAPLLAPGDTLLLQGPLGAGKSTLVRAVIVKLLGDPDAEIPSPSYTLVNVYETRSGPVWHADLYRLSGTAEELEELGLDEAMGTALVMVEWPDRLGNALPPRRITMALAPNAAGGRDLTATLHGAGWHAVAALLERWR